MAGKEDHKVILAQGGAEGTVVACEADGDGSAAEARAQGVAPWGDGLGSVLEQAALAFCGASSLSADVMWSIGPGNAKKGGKCCVGYRCQESSPRVGDSGQKGQASFRAAKACEGAGDAAAPAE